MVTFNAPIFSINSLLDTEFLGSSHYSKRNAVNIFPLNISVHNNNREIMSRCLLEYVQSTSTEFPRQFIFFGMDFYYVSNGYKRHAVLPFCKNTQLSSFFKKKKGSCRYKNHFSENKKVGRKQLPSAAICNVLSQHAAACCYHTVITAFELPALHKRQVFFLKKKKPQKKTIHTVTLLILSTH